MDVEQEEEEMETAQVLEANIPKLEEFSSAVVNSHAPTLISILSTVLSAPKSTPIPIYSMVMSVAQVPQSPTPNPRITNCNAIFPIPAIIGYAFGQGPHPSLNAQPEALVQPTMSAQAPISSIILALPHPFNVELDPADMDFLKMKSDQCKGRQKNAMMSEGETDSYGKIVEGLEQALREG